MYIIEPVFIIFPSICLLLSKMEKRHKILCVFCITVVFLLIYSFSLNGADIVNYNLIYNLVASPETYNEAHGEIGFKLLMRLCQILHFDYLTFRIVFLISTTLVLFYSVYKISPNFSLSVFFLSSMFVVYMISAYRQYIVIVFMFFWIYKYTQGKKICSIIGTGLLALFHISALVVSIVLVLFTIFKKTFYYWCAKLSLSKILIWIIVAFVLRILFVYAMRFESFGNAMSLITNGYSDGDVQLFSFGLLSRLSFLICITILMYKRKPQDKLSTLLYVCYFIGIIGYIAIPFVTFSGRLFNNFHILSVVLIPLLCTRSSNKINNFNVKVKAIKMNYINCLLTVTIIVAIAVLINQLLYQNGYTPYLNILLGHKLP